MNKVVVVILIIVVACCCCLALIPIGGAAAYGIFSKLDSSANPFKTVETEVYIKPTLMFTPEAPLATMPAEVKPAEEISDETLNTMVDTEVPVNDLRDLAERLKGIKNIPETVQSAAKNYQVGDVETFWASEDDTHKNFQVDAVLRYKGQHVYFWVDKSSQYDQPELEQLARAFDEKIYPTDREFFGSEWQPGIDNDPRLYILYVSGVGYRIAGYFSSNDEIHPMAHEYSNAHEMFIINSDTTGLGEPFTYGVLAHEFQHMIHWYRDRNEESWLNEGFSELAAFINGYDVGGFDYVFAGDPDIQLNDWPDDPDATTPHYGAGFLFVNYFLNRFGEDATKALVADTANGMSSIDDVLERLNITDASSGTAIRADDVFADWVVTNYLNSSSVGDGRYQYSNYPDAPRLDATQVIDRCPTELTDQTVHQYAADYIEIDCQGTYTLSFQGNTEVRLVPQDAHSGKYMFWSNKGDESDMTLTRAFDLSAANGDVSLNYWTWYDLEKDFDYVYVEVSRDNGKTWQILKTPSGTNEDPSGNSYGWAYNGDSIGWINESVDLSAYAGQKILVRFEYITDAAVNGEGLLLDDISISAIGYETDLEADASGWDTAGFVRVENSLPQTYRLSLITMEGNDTPRVENIPLGANQNADITLKLGSHSSKAVLVVSGTTRFTRSEAPYSIVIGE